MKEQTLKQYYGYDTELKTYQVDIDLDSYRDVYSEWDYSPMINRDLDEDLIEYILGCSYEIGLKRQMTTVFHIPKEIINPKREERSRIGMRHYFAYQIRKTKGQMFRILRTSLTYFLMGVVFLAMAISIKKVDQILFSTLKEGLYIGAWVVLWEMFYLWFFKMGELRLNIRHFKRLEEMKIIYKGK
ncbi:MAG: hypothetical protein JXR88_01165 [Clostridia bacterium]|nr:hypothetical protein [Clostridia bacterium]